MTAAKEAPMLDSSPHLNCYDAFYVVRGDVVADVWPVIPRGLGHHGLAKLG